MVSPELAARPNSFHRSAAHYAAYMGHVAQLDLIMAAFPSALDCADGSGNTPLHDAAGVGRAAIVQRIVAVRPEAATKCNQRGQTPVDRATTAEVRNAFGLTLPAAPTVEGLVSAS